MMVSKTDYSKNSEFDHALLKHFVPICDLHSEDREKMALKSTVFDMNMGEKLLTSEEHRWLLYVIEGEIDLRERGKDSQLICSDDDRALHPLFSERVHNVHAVARCSNTN